MVLKLTYKGKDYKFNMFEELAIKEINLDKDIKEHPSSYFFLRTLRTNLEALKKQLEANRKRVYNKAYKLAKAKTGANGRPMTDDLCKAVAESSDLYKAATKEAIEAERNWGMINDAVIAFEEKKALIQTLSANLRKNRDTI